MVKKALFTDAILSPDQHMNLGDILPDKDYGHQMRFTKGEIADFYAPGLNHSAIIEERKRWIHEAPGTYLALLPEGENLVDEVLEMASIKTANTEPITRCQALGEQWEADFLLMRPDSQGVFRMVGGSLCFPSHWDLNEKMNQPMTAIHNPVPDLNQDLGRQIDGFLKRIKPNISWERANWGLARSPELNQHPSRNLPRLDETVPLDEVWWRLEEQSLVALSESGGILFGIKVSVTPLADIICKPEARQGIARALKTMSEPMAHYKGLAPARKRLLKLIES